MLELQTRLAEESAVMTAAAGLSPEARMVTRYAELKAQIDQLEAEKKDIAKALLEHYNETGERASNGAQEVKVSERTTYEYDDASLRENMPDFYAQVSKVDSTRVAAAIKAKQVTEDQLSHYRSGKTTQVLTVGAAKP